MAISNHERVGKALGLLRDGLAPFVDREIRAALGSEKIDPRKLQSFAEDPTLKDKPITEWDVAGLLNIMWGAWNDAFRHILGPVERSLVSEMRNCRNRWAHQEKFSSDDAYRALDSAGRLLRAVSAPQSGDLEKSRDEFQRVRYEERTRRDAREKMQTTIESAVAGSLPPWRTVVTPHADVAGGGYQKAEFAADLWQVHLGEGSDEYRDPVEFFRRTYLTDSLENLLIAAVRRMAGKDGDPVVQLQTNFGGGKTHSMLALYHLFSGAKLDGLADVEQVRGKSGVSEMPVAKRVVLVGNKISPGRPSDKEDGTVVNTLWGELAWQLGGRKAFDRIAADDEKATSPGDALRELFNEYGPCLILIDEWVAYARQLHDQSDLPAGGFETHFSFAQALTESARAADNCLLVISLPASDTPASPHTEVEDVEVGGYRGREALHRLQNVIGRLQSSWRPAAAEESFEIVRRRLFEPLLDGEKLKQRDVVARTFSDMYRSRQQEFPTECREADYEKRIKNAYPIHPEVFDRLYEDWSTLVKFQRTRGVLRLMATVIHNLWENGDAGPLILPSNVAVGDSYVRSELTHYLTDNWVPIIEKDIDGPSSLPLRMDREVPALGKFSACRRVARTVFLGSAPIKDASHQGLEDRRINLGCVLPGETPAVFGDALRRLAGAATHLYQDGNRYWYQTQPTVAKLARERTEELKRDPEKVERELESRMQADLKNRGDFSRTHLFPRSAQEVPDELEVRLVVLGISRPYSREDGNAAQEEAGDILKSRGTGARLYCNTLVFLAADRVKLQDLDEAIRIFLAWQSILDDREALDISPHQVKQAQARCKSANDAVDVRIPETYQWLLVPVQSKPESPVEWQALRLSAQDPLAVRAGNRLRRDELLITEFAGTRLRMELDSVLWRGGDHVEVRQIVDDFARYLYLPRLREPSVLLNAIVEGVGIGTWADETFALADGFDGKASRYSGLRAGKAISLEDSHSQRLLVRSEAACKQLDEGGASDGTGDGTGDKPPSPPPPPPHRAKRFHGTVSLRKDRIGSDAGKIAEEVIAHLAGIDGVDVAVTLEIRAEAPAGVPDNVVRTVTENSRTLGFSSHGFEKE